MQLKFAFLLVAFAFVGAEDEACDEEKTGLCMLKLLSDVWEESSNEHECASLAEASSCLAEIAKDCTEEVGNRNLEEVRFLFRLIASMKCPQKDPSAEADKCVDDLEPELDTCVEDSEAEVLEHYRELPEETEVDEDRVKCQLYKSTTKCAVTKVAENCGEEASVIALAEMLSNDEIMETCKIPNLKEISLKDMLFELDKKRRK